MIHRALLGSLERFFGVLIEHYSGAFPLWLAPVQVCVIPITEKEQSYAAEVFHQLEEAGIRAELDDRNEKVGYKIREASTQKIPIMLVIGPREVQEQTVAIRKRGVGDVGSGSLAEVIKEIELQVAEKRIDNQQ
jgi:threonyl-tRNA synthetase